jgi:hypothetical protein
MVLVAVAFLLYFLPVIVAGIRKVQAWGGLFALNLLLGWTVVGWLGALIWAASGETESEAKSKVIDYAKLAAAMRESTHQPEATAQYLPNGPAPLDVLKNDLDDRTAQAVGDVPRAAGSRAAHWLRGLVDNLDHRRVSAAGDGSLDGSGTLAAKQSAD